MKYVNRLLNEPALVVAVVLAAGNVIGQDLSDVATLVESVLILAGGVLVRSRVTPTRKS